MSCSGEWSWSRHGVRKVECVQVRRNSPGVFADSDRTEKQIWRDPEWWWEVVRFL